MQWFFENSFLFLECIMENFFFFFFLVRFGFAEGVEMEMEMEMREETKGMDELDFVSFFFI